MTNHSLCILWMKRRSSAHVSFTHTPTSYFNSKANDDKKSTSKNKPKKKTKNKAPCNKHSSQLLQKKAPHTSSKKTINTLLHAVSHNYVIVSLLIIQQQSYSPFVATNLKYTVIQFIQSIKFNSGSTPTNFKRNRLNLLITFHSNFLTKKKNKKKSPRALPEHPTHYVITYTVPDI